MQRPGGPQDRQGGYYARRRPGGPESSPGVRRRLAKLLTRPERSEPLTVECRAQHFFPFPTPPKPMRRGKWLDRLTGRPRRSMWRTGVPIGIVLIRSAERRARTRNVDENAQLGIVTTGNEIGVPDRPKYRKPGGGIG